MNKRLLIFVGIGVLAVGVAVFLTVSGNEGSHLQLQGKILKVRTGALGDGNSIAVLDFRVENPSDIPFVVGNV
jgi:LEA14-like dessication related protein